MSNIGLLITPIIPMPVVRIFNNFSAGRMIVENALKSNFDEIITRPDFSKIFRAVSIFNLHVHELKIIKDEFYLIVVVNDNETQIEGENYRYCSIYDIPSNVWTGKINKTGYTTACSTFRSGINFVPFGDDYGSYSSVCIKNIPGYDVARRMKSTKDRTEYLYKMRKVYKQNKLL